MGKSDTTGGSSWLNVVKKAFRSPTKDANKSSKRRGEHEQQDDEKKRGKRRWIFSRHCIYQTNIQHNGAEKVPATSNSSLSNLHTGTNYLKPKTTHDPMNRMSSTEMASETRAAAEAALATAQAAVQVFDLGTTPPNIRIKYYAALIIQTAFRGYLARRALRALKGIVKLQALVRGHNVRNRATMTLHCIQSLIRVQAQLRDQQRRLSYNGSTIGSAFTERNFHHLAKKKSNSIEGSSSITDECDGHQHTLNQIRSMLQKTKEEAASKREKALSYAFSHQMWRSSKDKDLGCEEKGRWSDIEDTMQLRKRMDRNIRSSVEIDKAQSYLSDDLAPYSQRCHNHYHNFQHQKNNSYFGSSPIRQSHKNHYIPFYITPYLSKSKPLQAHSASPRYYKRDGRENTGAASMPNYMAATESTKARIQCQDVPRQRPFTPRRDQMVSARKRLSFADESYSTSGVMSDVEVEHSLTSPSRKRMMSDDQSSNKFCCSENSFGEYGY